MTRPADRLRDRLAPEERLRAEYAVRLSENAGWTPVTFGVTDRRVLWAGDDDDRTGSIDLDYVTAVRSHRRTRPTYGGGRRRLLLAGGGALAALCFLGVVALSASALAPLLTLVAAGGLGATAYLRRGFDGVQWAPVVGSATVAVAGFLGLVVSASGVLVPLLAALALGGLATVDRARRREDGVDGPTIRYRHEREVSVNTADGRTVHVRCDPSAAVDRELSRVAFVDRAEPTAVAQLRSEPGP